MPVWPKLNLTKKQQEVYSAYLQQLAEQLCKARTWRGFLEPYAIHLPAELCDLPDLPNARVASDLYTFVASCPAFDRVVDRAAYFCDRINQIYAPAPIPAPGSCPPPPGFPSGVSPPPGYCFCGKCDSAIALRKALGLTLPPDSPVDFDY